MGLLAAKLQKIELSPDQLEQISNRVVGEILSVSEPQRIIGFGSAFNGKIKRISDFDFAIIFYDGGDIRMQKRRIMTSKLFLDLPVDLLFFSQSDYEKKAEIGGICWQIKNQGWVLYDQRAKV